MDAAIPPPHHDHHLNRRVAVTDSRPGRRVRTGALVCHPAVQRIEPGEFFIHFRVMHQISLCPVLSLSLFQFIVMAQLLTGGIFGQFVLRRPAIHLLYQRGDLFRQADGLRQQFPCPPEQPLAVDCRAALIKGILSGIQHRADCRLHRLWAAAPGVAVQTANAL